MTRFTRKFTRDNGDELEVDGSYRIVDDSVEISEYTAWLWANRDDPFSPQVTLTDAEDNRLVEEIVADPDTWEYDNDY